MALRTSKLWLITSGLTAVACLVFAIAFTPRGMSEDDKYAFAAQRLQIYETLNDGMIAQFSDKLDDAMAKYREAIATDSKVGSAHYLLGTVLFKQEKYDEAIHEFDQALALEERTEHILNNRGVAHSRKGDVEEAERDFSAAMAVDPEFTLPQQNRGLLRLRAKQDVGALDDFNHVIAHFEKPTALASHTGRAIIRARQGSLASADEDFTTVLEYARGKERVLDALYNRARIREARGDTAAAQKDREQYAKLEALPKTADRFVHPLKGDDEPKEKDGQQ